MKHFIGMTGSLLIHISLSVDLETEEILFDKGCLWKTVWMAGYVFPD
jgi:hypothetical protein